MALTDLLPFGKKHDAGPQILPVLPEEIYKAGVLDLQDVIAPHALKINSRELDLGERIARTFFVISYPRFLTTGWFAPIINMDKVLDISMMPEGLQTALKPEEFAEECGHGRHHWNPDDDPIERFRRSKRHHQC